MRGVKYQQISTWASGPEEGEGHQHGSTTTTDLHLAQQGQDECMVELGCSGQTEDLDSHRHKGTLQSKGWVRRQDEFQKHFNFSSLWRQACVRETEILSHQQFFSLRVR